MSYTDEEWFGRVVDAAAKAHADQVDGCGEPYIDHLKRTAAHLVRLFPEASREEIEAAILHDIFEDTDATDEEVLAAGVTPGAVAIARELTKPVGTADYRGWIISLTVHASTSALRVKLADNADNRDLRRVAKSNSLTRVACKYDPAKAILEGEIAWRRNVAAGRIKRLA